MTSAGKRNKIIIVAQKVPREMDWQIFQLQRKYLDYQVNIGNRIIQVLQSGQPDAAEQAQALSAPKKLFQDMIDDLFKETGKKIVRTENEV